uniref:Pellino FHA domain-containing protein n=1 Tax=Seriola lalandi dorsalis TaxID=1841481 RepID=A0A3B4XC19_SERLL
MDGLTTNGVLVMHPRHGFSQDSKPGLWREISVCGNVFTLRETRSSQQRGKMVVTQSVSVGQCTGVIHLSSPPSLLSESKRR